MASTAHQTRQGGPTDAGRGNRSVQAALVIAAAVVVAVAVWALAGLVGVETVADKGAGDVVVTTADVVVAAVVAGLAAWGTRALLGRIGRARWWPFTGSTALAASMIGPSYQADGASAIVLICLHVAVGVTLIAGFSHWAGGLWRPA